MQATISFRDLDSINHEYLSILLKKKKRQFLSRIEYSCPEKDGR